MLEQSKKYDPRIYGDLGAKYLNSLAPFQFIAVDEAAQDEEKKRQELIKEIKEGKLGANGR